MSAHMDQVQNIEIEPIRAGGAMKRRALYGAFSIALVLAAPLAGRVAGTAWGAVNAYRNAMELFHSKKIALNITGQVLMAAYRTYLYGK